MRKRLLFVLEVFGFAIAAPLFSGCNVSPSLWPLYLGLDYETEYFVEAEVEPASLNALAEPGSAIQVHFDIRGLSPPVALACHTADGIVGISLVAEKADDEISGNNENRVVEAGEWETFADGGVLSGSLRGFSTRVSCDEDRRGNAVLATVSPDLCGRVDFINLNAAEQQDAFSGERLALSDGFDLGATCYDPDIDEERVEPEHVVVRLDDD